MLPNFLIVGAQKSGTNALHAYLGSHPQFSLSWPKELHFFDRIDYEADPDEYRRQFRGRDDASFVGESTAFYLNFPAAAQRITELLPEVRIMVLLRNPVDRAYSHYWHETKHGWENLSFEEALAAESSRVVSGYREWQHYSYLIRGLYSVYLKEFVDVFGRERVWVRTFEELVQDPYAITAQAIEFMGADPIALPSVDGRVRYGSRSPRIKSVSLFCGWLDRQLGERNVFSRLIRRANLKQASYPPMIEQTRASLVTMFLHDLPHLEAICGRRFNWFDHETDLISSAALPTLDWGVFEDYWQPRCPPELRSLFSPRTSPEDEPLLGRTVS